jgi:hypothetical protein
MFRRNFDRVRKAGLGTGYGKVWAAWSMICLYMEYIAKKNKGVS